jgi:hypothetical protein
MPEDDEARRSVLLTMSAGVAGMGNYEEALKAAEPGLKGN